MLCFEYEVVPVQYFLDEMPLWDLNDLIIGVSYKNRQQWEMVRTSSYLNMAPHCKKIDMKKILPFKWDEEYDDVDTSISNEEIERIRNISKKFESKI